MRRKIKIKKQIIYPEEYRLSHRERDAVFSVEIQYSRSHLTLQGLIDLTAIRDKEYLSDLYKPDGTLKKPVSGSVLGLGNLSPLSLDGSDIFKLLTNQRIIGLYNADTLGSVESILELTENAFNAIVTRLVVVMQSRS